MRAVALGACLFCGLVSVFVIGYLPIESPQRIALLIASMYFAVKASKTGEGK